MAVTDHVAALAAAGNDVHALEQAIKAASHLDDKPGDDRQKLRGDEPERQSLLTAPMCDPAPSGCSQTSIVVGMQRLVLS